MYAEYLGRTRDGKCARILVWKRQTNEMRPRPGDFYWVKFRSGDERLYEILEIEKTYKGKLFGMSGHRRWTCRARANGPFVHREGRVSYGPETSWSRRHFIEGVENPMEVRDKWERKRDERRRERLERKEREEREDAATIDDR